MLDAAEAGPVPAPLVAVTVRLYESPGGKAGDGYRAGRPAGALAAVGQGGHRESSSAIDWGGKGIVIDLSQVFSNPLVLRLLMVGVTSWLTNLFASRGARRLTPLLPGARRVVVHRRRTGRGPLGPVGVAPVPGLGLGSSMVHRVSDFGSGR